MDENKIIDRLSNEILKAIKFLTPFAIIALIVNVITVISSAKHCYYYSEVKETAMFLADDKFKFSINDIMNFSIVTKNIWIIMAVALVFYCVFTWVKDSKKYDFKIRSHDFILIKLVSVIVGFYYMVAFYIGIIDLDKFIIKQIIPEELTKMTDFKELYPRSLNINILIFAYAIFVIVIIFNLITSKQKLGVNRALVRFIFATIIPFVPIGAINYIGVYGQGIIFENEAIIFKLVVIAIYIFINFHECSKAMNCIENSGGE